MYQIRITVFILLICTSLAESTSRKKVEAFFQGRCSYLSPCHQICVDIIGGGYQCACADGYTLQSNGFTCLITADDVQTIDSKLDKSLLPQITTTVKTPNNYYNFHSSFSTQSPKISQSTTEQEQDRDVIVDNKDVMTSMKPADKSIAAVKEIQTDVKHKIVSKKRIKTNLNRSKRKERKLHHVSETSRNRLLKKKMFIDTLKSDLVTPSEFSDLPTTTKRSNKEINISDILDKTTKGKNYSSSYNTFNNIELLAEKYSAQFAYLLGNDSANYDYLRNYIIYEIKEGKKDKDANERNRIQNHIFSNSSLNRDKNTNAEFDREHSRELEISDNDNNNDDDYDDDVNMDDSDLNTSGDFHDDYQSDDPWINKRNSEENLNNFHGTSTDEREKSISKRSRISETGVRYLKHSDSESFVEYSGKRLPSSGGWQRSHLDSDWMSKSAAELLYHPKSCQNIQCAGGGHCVQGMEGGARCRCPLGTTGLLCEQEQTVKYPMFQGTSYIAFPVLREASKEFTIEIRFRPDSPDGLLLFSADHADAKYDFFSLALMNGHVEFRFDCGSGVGTLRSQTVVQLSVWNTVFVYRSEWNAWLELNKGVQTSGHSKGKFSRINFREDLYLGGHENISRVAGRTGQRHGLSGCVSSLRINSKAYDMRRGAFTGDAIRGIDIDDCSAGVCKSVSCLNGGTCSVSGADTSVCLCPLGFAGKFCETREIIQVPKFTGSSYFQYKGLQRNVLSFTEVELILKPAHPDGLIFYNGYSRDRTGDFISLALRDGYVEYRFDLGTGSTLIRSLFRLSMNEWHTVKFFRTGRNGFMKVDNDSYVEGMSSGAFTQLTLLQDLFLGGHRNFDEVAKVVDMKVAFHGCIQKMKIGKRPVRLLEESMKGVNIEGCDHPCVGAPCQNGGRCVPDNDRYHCACPLGYSNTNCQDNLSKDKIDIPSFSGTSFLVFTDQDIVARTRGRRNEIDLKVKVKDSDGLLLWISDDETTPYSDYLSLGLREGQVVFSFNLGGGEIEIISNSTRLDDGQWHTIRLERFDTSGFLEVDGKNVIEGTSPGHMRHLTTLGSVYIGGMPDIVQGTLRKYTKGFSGCISKLSLSKEHSIDLVRQANNGGNIVQCADAL